MDSQLQRLRSPNAAATDRAQAVDRCRRAAKALEKQTDLQPDAIRTPAPPERQTRRMSEFERDLWERATAKYPVESRTPEVQKKLERKIKAMVQENEPRQAAPPAAYQQSRGHEHGMER